MLLWVHCTIGSACICRMYMRSLPQKELVGDDDNVEHNQWHCTGEGWVSVITAVCHSRCHHFDSPRSSMRTAPIKFTILAFTPGS